MAQHQDEKQDKKQHRDPKADSHGTGKQGISNRTDAPGDLGRQHDEGMTSSKRQHMDVAGGHDDDEGDTDRD
jgi:hypothetical protein